jgi:hypothetical protein
MYTSPLKHSSPYKSIKNLFIRFLVIREAYSSLRYIALIRYSSFLSSTIDIVTNSS